MNREKLIEIAGQCEEAWIVEVLECSNLSNIPHTEMMAIFFSEDDATSFGENYVRNNIKMNQSAIFEWIQHDLDYWIGENIGDGFKNSERVLLGWNGDNEWIGTKAFSEALGIADDDKLSAIERAINEILTEEQDSIAYPVFCWCRASEYDGKLTDHHMYVSWSFSLKDGFQSTIDSC